MTAPQIKRLLRENKKRGVRPWALKHFADDKGVHRSIATRAVKTPGRYPEMRAYIEQTLVASAGRTA